jgi:hypothetical protein
MILRKSSTDAASGFFGDERWSVEVPPLASLSVALRALFLIQRVLNQFGAGRRSLRQRRANAAPTPKNTAHIAIVGGYVFTSHLIEITRLTIVDGQWRVLVAIGA